MEHIRFLQEKNDGKRDQTFAEVCDKRDESVQSARSGVQVSAR